MAYLVLCDGAWVFCQWGLHVFAAFAQELETSVKSRLFAQSFTVSQNRSYEYIKGDLSRCGRVACSAKLITIQGCGMQVWLVYLQPVTSRWRGNHIIPD